MDAAGIQTIYIDYHAEKLESHQKSIEAIGKALGKEERAAENQQVLYGSRDKSSRSC